MRDAQRGAINARRTPVTLFDPDPRGWALFANLAARQARGMNGADGTTYGPAQGVAGTAYHGDARWTPQTFVGQAALGGAGLGAGKPFGSRTDLQRETSTLLADGPMQIYRARMLRTMGNGSMGGE